MQDTRMGLGTDQLELPAGMAGLPPVVPPQARTSPGRSIGHPPVVPAPVGLAPWAAQLQLPGVDT